MSLKTGNRLQKLRQKLAGKEIDAIFVSQPENRYYLSDFDGSSGYLLITEKTAILATDFRYIEQAKIQSPDYEIFKINGEVADWFHSLLSGQNITRLGIEGGHINLTFYQQLAEAVARQSSPLQLLPVDGLVESLRAVKEPEEIELISQAAGISDNAAKYAEEIIHAGISEKQLAWEIEKFLRENGSEAIPFDIIVASGPNSAMPHARPTQRVINPGEPIVIDIGARVKGYCSDLSRTLCLGAPDNTFRKIYDTVLDAQLTAMSIIKEGFTGEQADNIARRVIEQAGYQDAFGHSLGHGIGLAPHEAPRLGPGSTEILTSGMTFTIEPGIYLPGWGGIRIEDLVVLDNGKVKVISKARKD